MTDSLQRLPVSGAHHANGREYIGGRTSETRTSRFRRFLREVFPTTATIRAHRRSPVVPPPRDDGPRAAPSGKGRFDRFKGGAKPQDEFSGSDSGQRNPMTHAAPADDIQDDDIPF